MKELKTRQVEVKNIKIGGDNPIVLIAGPCVIEGKKETYALAEKLKQITDSNNVPLIFKASYDKANRTSVKSFRGPGLRLGLEVLNDVKEKLQIPVLSDVHRFEEIGPASEVLDVIQVPAYLCRQTDFIIEIARTGKALNIKKGQFLAPGDMQFIVEKIKSTGNHNILLTERGTTFGYNNLVVDMRSLVIMREHGYPVVFDATHSVQLPGGKGNSSGGELRFIAPLARAASAIGVDAIFMETHEKPDEALCDGPNSLQLADMSCLIKQILYHSKFGAGKFN
jgi:2-dehydro-3-deoxyphosphooctonate aldolase (KDO 8-P synthase)